MKKLFVAIALFFTLGQIVKAGPFDLFTHPVRTVKQHPVVGKILAAGVAAGVHAYGLHHCAQGDVERCQAGYGSRWASYGVTVSLNALFIPLSEKIGGKQGDVISYGGSAAELGFGIQQWRNYKPENSSVTK